MMKSKRHGKILELVGEHEIETQTELTQLLAAAGFPVSQDSVSRDIYDLKLTKVPAARRAGYRFAIPAQQDEARMRRIFRDGFTSMDCAGNFLVVRTFTGMAMAVAAALDAMRLPEAVGSIAGDDVVMCATKSEAEAQQLMETLKKVVAE